MNSALHGLGRCQIDLTHTDSCDNAQAPAMLDLNLNIIVHISPTEANKIDIARRPVDIY